MADVELISHRVEAVQALHTQLGAALDGIGRQCARYAAENVEKAGLVKTGGLAGSFGYMLSTDKRSVSIGTNNEHAAFHELGTGYYNKSHSGVPYGVPAQHFLRNAAAGHVKQWIAMLYKAMEG